MELKFNATIELRPKDVEELVKQKIAELYPTFWVKSVSFDADMHYDQFDRGSGTPTFTGIKVHIEPRAT